MSVSRDWNKKRNWNKKIVALAGGVGAARFLDGLARVVEPERLFVIGNVGDDAEIHGLHISPDLDTVLYTLAGLAHPGQGWGIRGDTFRCLDRLAELGGDAWFRLGDLDIATHLYRTDRLRAGASLSEVTRELVRSLGVRAMVVPATDGRVRTMVETNKGKLEFQEYFVKRQASDVVHGFDFDGAAVSRPAPGVLEAIEHATAILLCPSNPFISIGPILAIPGVREALGSTRAPVAAISPIVGGKALKGPAARMMKSMGKPVSALGVSSLYADFVKLFVLDTVDARQAAKIESSGMRTLVTNTIMSGPREKKALAKAVLSALEVQ